MHKYLLFDFETSCLPPFWWKLQAPSRSRPEVNIFNNLSHQLKTERVKYGESGFGHIYGQKCLSKFYWILAVRYPIRTF